MHGNVDSPANRKDGGRTVDVEGWMQWDPGDTSAVFTITVDQNGVSGVGSKTYTAPDTSWDIDATATNGGRFQKGPATVQVSAEVSNSSGPPTTVDWPATVEIH